MQKPCGTGTSGYPMYPVDHVETLPKLAVTFEDVPTIVHDTFFREI